MKPIEVYYLYLQSYEREDRKLINSYFEDFIDFMYEFNIEPTKEQKEKIGQYLLENSYIDDLEDYDNYLTECARESAEEERNK